MASTAVRNACVDAHFGRVTDGAARSGRPHMRVESERVRSLRRNCCGGLSFIESKWCANLVRAEIPVGSAISMTRLQLVAHTRPRISIWTHTNRTAKTIHQIAAVNSIVRTIAQGTAKRNTTNLPRPCCKYLRFPDANVPVAQALYAAKGRAGITPPWVRPYCTGAGAPSGHFQVRRGRFRGNCRKAILVAIYRASAFFLGGSPN